MEHSSVNPNRMAASVCERYSFAGTLKWVVNQMVGQMPQPRIGPDRGCTSLDKAKARRQVKVLSEGQQVCGHVRSIQQCPCQQQS